MFCFKNDEPLLFHICSVAGTRWPKGLAYNNGGLHSILLTNVMVVVAAHTPCRGGPWTSSLRHGPTPKRMPHRVPNPARRAFRHVLRFGSPLHGVSNPRMRSFRVVSRFGSPLHGVPNPKMRSFRVVSRFGSPLHGVPNPRMRSFRVMSCARAVASSVTLWSCVIVCVAALRGQPFRAHSAKEKTYACILHPKISSPAGPCIPGIFDF